MAIEKNTNKAQKICKIYYTPIIYVDSIFEYNNRYSVDFKTGKSWSAFDITKSSAKLKQTQKHATAGETYDQLLTVFYPGEDNDNIYNFETIQDVPMLLRLIYTSGQERLYGTLDNPVKMFKNQEIGNKTGSTILFKRVGPPIKPLDTV